VEKGVTNEVNGGRHEKAKVTPTQGGKHAKYEGVQNEFAWGITPRALTVWHDVLVEEDPFGV
jgi:hypothetical protein